MPLTGIAALGAVVTPMAVLTSCNKTTVSKLEVDASKAKTEYYYGEKLDTTNLVLKATMSDKSVKTLNAKDCKFTPSLETALTLEYETVVVEFGGQKATFNIDVYENILQYAWRENPREGEGTMTLNEAANAYFTEGNVKANMIDDIFWHLSYYARLVQGLFDLEARSTTTTISKAIIEIVGEQFSDIGLFSVARGTVKNLSFNYNSTEHKAYMNADIIMDLTAQINNRPEYVEGTTTKLEKTGDYKLTVKYHISDVPYIMTYIEDEGGFIAYPDYSILKTATKPLQTNWSLSHKVDALATYIDEAKEPVAYTLSTIWNKNKLVDPTNKVECPLGNPLNFISWNCYYLENYTLTK